MKIDRMELLASLRLVRPGVDKDSTNIQGMDCYIFKDGRVYASDDAIALSTDTKLTGDFAVPALEFYTILSKFKTEEVEFTESDSDLFMVCGRAKASIAFRKDDVSRRIKAIAPRENDWIPIEPGFAHQIGLCEIKNMGAQISEKFGGVFVLDKTAIATDNHSIVRTELKNSMERMWLSARSVGLLKNMETTRYCCGGAWVHFESEKLRISCRRQTDDAYPFVFLNKTMDSLENGEVSGEMPADLYELVDKASVFAKNKENMSTIGMEFQEGKIVIRSGTHSGAYEEDMEIKIAGLTETIPVIVNANRMKQVLSKHESVPFTIGNIPGGEKMLVFAKEGYTEALGFYKE